MKTLSVMCAVVGVGLTLGCGAYAQADSAPPNAPTDNATAIPHSEVRQSQRVTLEFRDTPIREALNSLFRGNGEVRYTLDNAVPNTMKVNASIRNLYFDSALNMVLRSAGLRATRGQGRLYTITLRYPPDLGPPEVNDPPVPESRLPTQLPRDFNIRIAYGVGGKNVLDTFKGTFTKDLVADPPVTTPLTLTHQEKLRIYRKLAAIHFFSYPDEFTLPSHGGMIPSGSLDLVVRSYHRTQTFHWLDGSDVNTSRRHLRELTGLVQEIVMSKPAYKKLPEVKGGYL